MKISKLRPSRVPFIFKFEVSVSVQFDFRGGGRGQERLHRKIAFQRVDRLDNGIERTYGTGFWIVRVDNTHAAARDSFLPFYFLAKAT